MSIAQDLRSNNPASCALCDADSVKYIRCGRGDCAWVDALREEAADRIEALEAALRRTEDHMRGFAEISPLDRTAETEAIIYCNEKLLQGA